MVAFGRCRIGEREPQALVVSHGKWKRHNGLSSLWRTGTKRTQTTNEPAAETMNRKAKKYVLEFHLFGVHETSHRVSVPMDRDRVASLLRSARRQPGTRVTLCKRTGAFRMHHMTIHPCK